MVTFASSEIFACANLPLYLIIPSTLCTPKFSFMLGNFASFSISFCTSNNHIRFATLISSVVSSPSISDALDMRDLKLGMNRVT